MKHSQLLQQLHKTKTKYQTVGTAPEYNRHIHDRSLPWVRAGTSIKMWWGEPSLLCNLPYYRNDINIDFKEKEDGIPTFP